jgi:AcrR family transcriptional regulator
MDEKSLGLRERKKERVREQLMEAAFRLFEERGFDATTIDDVVNAVEVSRRTFFRYFKSKEDVLLGWFDRTDEDMRSALEARPPEEEPFLAMRRALTDVIQRYERNCGRMLALDCLIMATPCVRARKQAMHADWAEQMAATLAKRLGVELDRDLRPRLVANVALSILSSAVQTWRANGGRDSLAKLIEDGFRFVEEGHAPPGDRPSTGRAVNGAERAAAARAESPPARGKEAKPQRAIRPVAGRALQKPERTATGRTSRTGRARNGRTSRTVRAAS